MQGGLPREPIRWRPRTGEFGETIRTFLQPKSSPRSKNISTWVCIALYGNHWQIPRFHTGCKGHCVILVASYCDALWEKQLRSVVSY